MLKTKTINKTITTMLILLLTLSMLNVINFIAIPRVSAVTPVNITQPTVGIAVNETGYWKASGTYTTSSTPIQAAITAASGGDNITVAAGTYSENAIVNKQLTLEGASSATVTVTALDSGLSSVFTVTASVNISGFTVSGANEAYGGEPQPAGIYLASGAVHCNISNNKLTGNFDGIKLGTGSNHNTLTNNTLSSNAGQGFEIVNSTYNTFTNNNASSNTRYGFKLENASHNTFTGNTANSNTVNGFHLVKGPITGTPPGVPQQHVHQQHSQLEHSIRYPHR
jgi:parallel beta-helix repeat protein